MCSVLWSQNPRMNSSLSNSVRYIIKLAQGFNDPEFDEKLQIVNWPSNFTTEVKELSGLLQGSKDEVELRACADILNADSIPGVPDGLLQLLSRSLFDNPNTPLRES